MSCCSLMLQSDMLQEFVADELLQSDVAVWCVAGVCCG